MECSDRNFFKIENLGHPQIILGGLGQILVLRSLQIWPKATKIFITKLFQCNRMERRMILDSPSKIRFVHARPMLPKQNVTLVAHNQVVWSWAHKREAVSKHRRARERRSIMSLEGVAGMTSSCD